MERSPSPDGSTEGAKTWFDYSGKVNVGGGDWGTRGTNRFPLFVARILPDTTNQFTLTELNSWEKPTRIVDTYTSSSSVGIRTNNFVYSTDGIDLVEHRGPSNELLSGNAYNSFHQVTLHTNEVGYLTTFTYDSNHRLTGALWPSGLVTTNYYFTSGSHVGWLDKTVDYESSTYFRTNSFTYVNGLQSTQTDPRGLIVTNTWDNMLRPTALNNPGGTTTLQYDKLDLLRIINPFNATNRFSYDTMSRLLSVTDDQSTNSFKYLCGWQCHSTNALLQIEKYDYDYNGNLTKTTHADGSISSNRFDSLNRLTNSIDPALKSVSFFYNFQGLPLSASNAIGQLFLRKYDVRDRVTNSVDANGVSVNITYDNLGRVTKRTYPNGGEETFEYSARGLINHTNALTFGTHYGYDALGRQIAVTNANGEVVRSIYSPGGDLLAYVDGKGRTNQFSYNQYGRLTNKVDAAGTTILRFKYDALGRLTNRWSNAKGDTYYTYNKVNNLTNVNYPSSPDLSFGFDALNRLTSMVDEAGTTAFTYTSFGPLRSEDGPFANDMITWDYQTNHLRSGFSLLQPNSSPVIQTYGYDNGNRLQTITGLPGTFTYSYKGAGGLLDKILYPSGAYVTNSFDSSAQLLATKLRNSSHTDLNLHSYGYNLGGQRTNQTRWDGSAVTYGYDKIGQLQSATGKESGGTSRLNEQFGYAYDAAWNVQNRTNNAFVQTFNTDSLNQLTTLTRANTLTVAGMTTSPATNVTVNGYAASRYGDNTFAKEGFSLSDGNNTFTAIAQDSYGRSETNAVTLNLPATVSYIYDGNGNLTSDGSKGYTYDDENQLIQITSTNSWKTEITYDAFQRRRVRSEYSWISSAWVLKAQVRYVYDGKLVVQERDANNAPQVQYTRGLDASGSTEGAGGIAGLLARSQSPVVNPEHSFYHADGSGNVTALINANQQVVAKYLYDPFGRVLASSGPMADANLYRFSSKEVHENSGLVYYGRRYYEPSLQRWLSCDPIAELGGLNLHRFVRNNSLNYLDAWGLYDRLPSARLGTWGGIPGDSSFFFRDPEMAQKYPYGVRFFRGVPDFASNGALVINVPRITRDRQWEIRYAEEEIRKSFPDWERPEGYQWHHFIRDGRYELQLVPRELNGIPHSGPIARLNRVEGQYRAKEFVNKSPRGLAFLAAILPLFEVAASMASVSDDTFIEMRGHIFKYQDAFQRGDNLYDEEVDLLLDIEKIFGTTIATVASRKFQLK